MAKVVFYSPKLKPSAQQLRRSMTPQEKQLWFDYLKGYPVQFRRQKQFGRFIVDFYCARAKLVIEIDGMQHSSEQGFAYDSERSNYLRSLGLSVIRFTNRDIDRHFESVCSEIHNEVQTKLLDHSMSPEE